MIEFIKSCFNEDVIDFWKFSIGYFGPFLLVWIVGWFIYKIYRHLKSKSKRRWLTFDQWWKENWKKCRGWKYKKAAQKAWEASGEEHKRKMILLTDQSRNAISDIIRNHRQISANLKTNGFNVDLRMHLQVDIKILKSLL